MKSQMKMLWGFISESTFSAPKNFSFLTAGFPFLSRFSDHYAGRWLSCPQRGLEP